MTSLMDDPYVFQLNECREAFSLFELVYVDKKQTPYSNSGVGNSEGSAGYIRDKFGICGLVHLLLG
jgi:hypothetical protein